MRIFGLAGWSGSGKTTLMTALIPELVRARRLRVSTIKHAHHDFDVDQPGKDSWRHRQAGASEVMVASARRWALMHELRDAPEPSLDELIARMSAGRPGAGRRLQASAAPQDRGAPPVCRQAVPLSRRPAYRRDRLRRRRCRLPLPLLPLDEPAAIADFILAPRRARRDGPAERRLLCLWRRRC